MSTPMPTSPAAPSECGMLLLPCSGDSAPRPDARSSILANRGWITCLEPPLLQPACRFASRFWTCSTARSATARAWEAFSGDSSCTCDRTLRVLCGAASTGLRQTLAALPAGRCGGAGVERRRKSDGHVGPVFAVCRQSGGLKNDSAEQQCIPMMMRLIPIMGYAM